MYTEQLIRQITEDVARRYLAGNSYMLPAVRVGISNRHVHLCKKDLNALFGNDCKLTKMKDLSQTGQFASRETVTIKGPRGCIEKVRILGPEREKTQVEILLSDTYKLGIKAPLRESGDTANTPGIIISGPNGTVNLSEGIIVAARHIHANDDEAIQYGLRNGDRVRVSIKGDRGVEFNNVLVRVHPSFRMEFHIDMDEANAADVIPGDIVEILKN